MKKAILCITVVLFALLSCRDNADKAAQEQKLKAKADSLTSVAQQQIMKHLMHAIQEGGAAYAVQFCNLEATALTDAAAADFPGSIQRLSDKNRNPGNTLKTETDKQIFEYFREVEHQKDSLLQDNNAYVYYKRINLAMPACMQCHGAPATIAPDVLAAIDRHYPNDKAKGYNLNELRGLWKVSFDKDK